MGQVSKIRQLGLEHEALQLKGKGFGTRAIAQQLSEHAGQPISHMAIDTFLKSIPDNLISDAKEAYKMNIQEQIDDLQAYHYTLLKESAELAKVVKFEIQEGKRDVLDYRYALDEMRRQLEQTTKFVVEVSLPRKESESHNEDVADIQAKLSAAREAIIKEGNYRVGLQ